ncbi:MAG: DUF131 domain-containing protein [Candidatus Bathyarchaeota archaeon]|nr:DUF131 domain-containing protein [Candidatus Bathyarchaeota archaeon]
MGASGMVDLSIFYMLGIALVVAGIIVIVVALAKASMGGGKEGKSRVRGGGVVMIGPIPIIFGTDKNSVKEVVALALALTVVVLIVFLLFYWLGR